jgi:hypothetical protein
MKALIISTKVHKIKRRRFVKSFFISEDGLL